MKCEHCQTYGDLLPYYIGNDSHVWLHQRCSPQWHDEWRARNMAFEHKENSGSLFRNQRKEKDTHPDHTGSAKIDGVDYWISAWINEKDDGTKHFGLKFKPKDEQQAKPKQQEAAPEDFDDAIPF